MHAQVSELKLIELKDRTRDIRISILEMLAEAGSGHAGGALGLADIFSVLYFHILKNDPKNPDWPNRDRLVVSNGHTCPALYAAMAHAGYFELSELLTLRKFGSRLQGHPHREWLPMIETSSGPLGSGLSQAVGMALAERISRQEFAGGAELQGFPPKAEMGNAPYPLESPSSKFIYCIMSDGELDEGNTWEAIMLAGKERLSNLIAIVDRNNIQLSGPTEKVMPLEPLRQKWESFGWRVFDIDGHDFREIIEAVENAKASKNKPSVIIAHTTLGKGVSFMENNYEWHGKAPNKEEATRAIKELISNKV